MGSLDANTTAASKTHTSSPVSKKSTIVSGNEGKSAFANIPPKPTPDKKVVSPSNVNVVVVGVHSSDSRPATAAVNQALANQAPAVSANQAPAALANQAPAVSVIPSTRDHDVNVLTTEPSGVDNQSTRAIEPSVNGEDVKGQQPAPVLPVSAKANQASGLPKGAATKDNVLGVDCPGSKFVPSSSPASKGAAPVVKVSKSGGTAKRSVTPSASSTESDVVQRPTAAHSVSNSRVSHWASSPTDTTYTSVPVTTPSTPKTTSSNSPSVSSSKVSSGSSSNPPKGPQGTSAASVIKASTTSVAANSPKVSSPGTMNWSKAHSTPGVDPPRVSVGVSNNAVKSSNGPTVDTPIATTNENSSGPPVVTTKVSSTTSANRATTPTAASDSTLICVGD